MPDSNQNNKINLSRRKVLAASGAIGASGLGAGLGANALFSDEEQFANNQLTAGELDMKVSWAEHYFRDQDAAIRYAHRENGKLVIDDPNGFMNATLQEQFPDKQTRKRLDEGEADPCEVLADVPDDLEKPVIELEDIKPGDFGEITFDFALCGNPGFVWLTGRLRDDGENGLTEPERQAPDETDGVVELLDELAVTIWYDNNCDNLVSDGEDIVFEGSLRSALTALSSGQGLLLDADRASGGVDCYAPAPERHCISFKWELPRNVSNEVQSDSGTFDLGFYAEQCRHNTADVVTVDTPVEVTFDPVDDEFVVYYPIAEEVFDESFDTAVTEYIEPLFYGGRSLEDLSHGSVGEFEMIPFNIEERNP